MKKLNITLVSDNLPKGCGLATYHDNLTANLKDRINIKHIGVRKLFGNYPIKVFSPIRTKIAHFTDQKAAAVLFFSPFRKYKAVVTVHDITEIINYKNVCRINSIKGKIVHKIWNWIIKKSLKKADALIAVSEYTKKDIQKMLGRKKRVYMIHEAADKSFKQKQRKRAKTAKITQSVLYVGSNLAHKNLKTLVEAFSHVVKKLPCAKLILVGKGLSNDRGLKKLIKKLNIEKNITFKGYIRDTSREYSKAGVFVFPSLYEGFGLPILEAMACGCPVICSNRTSLPEVAGDAAVYFNGYDAGDLAKKICKVLTDKKLQQRLRKKGFSQANRFSWERCAKETLYVYKKMSC